MSVYLDNSATTAQRREVTEAMTAAMENTWGNPSSLHRMGVEAEKLVKASRKTVARVLGASEEEIYFTSGGTESDNTAIFGACEARKRAGRHIITTAIEHPAVLECFRKLENSGFEVTYLAPDKTGIVSAKAVESALREDTVLVSVMHANNETGALQPIEKIGALLSGRERVFFHCDAVQSFGKMPISVHQLKIDALSASGHKIHGPKGMGILYVNHNSRIVPYLYGGGQEHHMRSGTENVPGIAGIARAAELASADMQENFVHVTQIRDHFLRGILSEISDVRVNTPLTFSGSESAGNLQTAGGKLPSANADLSSAGGVLKIQGEDLRAINGDLQTAAGEEIRSLNGDLRTAAGEETRSLNGDLRSGNGAVQTQNGGLQIVDGDSCLPYILNVSFLGTRAEVLLHMLEQSEIYVSTGSACSSNSKKKGSHVLQAMGLTDDEIEGAVRFSFSYRNTIEEIEETLEKLKDAVSKNRKMLALANKSKAQRRR